MPSLSTPLPSSVDWCELNYQLSSFIAEYFNTISNIVYIVMCGFGLVKGLEKGYLLRELMLFVCVFVVGIGYESPFVLLRISFWY